MMFQKILVAIDDSESSRAIFEQALTLAKTTHSELMLSHIIIPFDPAYLCEPYLGMPQPSMQVHWDRLKEQEQAGLERLRSLETEASATGVSTEFTQNLGDPGRLICELAKSWGADLIIIGRRGLSGLGELWLGSVSNYVLHHAPCHVLTIQGTVQPQPQTEPAGVAVSGVK
jgi:nucleotide-binding universal stress UspA family protein